MTKANEFVTFEAVYHGELAWWWTAEKLHDTEYNIEVRDSLAKEVLRLSEKYGIEENTQYCTQFEGVELIGSNELAVKKATMELARHLARFKGVRPL